MVQLSFLPALLAQFSTTLFSGSSSDVQVPLRTVPGVAASSGCGSASPWPFDSTGHYNVSVNGRSFLVHIPSNYNDNDAHAVVLSFHGYSKNDTNQEKISQFSDKGVLINGKGIIAVYPNGEYGPGRDGKSPERAWQGAPYAKSGVDDIAFTETIVEEVQTNLCVDTNRIYASGKSNGGGFTNLLACTSSTASIFAAFAPVSAALYSGTQAVTGCSPGSKIAVINFHGILDTTIPYIGQSADSQGNTAYALPDIDVYRAAWASRNCNSSSPSSVANPSSNTMLESWDCTVSLNNSAAVVQGYTVLNLGHSWPTTKGLDGTKNSTASFNATSAFIVPFFEAHTL